LDDPPDAVPDRQIAPCTSATGAQTTKESLKIMKHAGTNGVLLTVDDLARILNCGKTKAWELVNTRQIPTIRVGRLVRISPDDLAEFMREHRE
jgi:excisionase family DNA binding protein